MAASRPSYSEPFPAGLPSLHGCFALETDPARRNAVLTKDRHAPILYMTRLRTRGPCTDMRTLALRLEKQCHEEHARAALPGGPPPPPCTPDHTYEVLAQRVCDFYEGEGPGAWKGFYLTECDCLKRDHVPPLAEVVAACRDKAADQAAARQAYNDALAADPTNSAQLRRPPVTVDAAMCDDLEAGVAVRMQTDDRDYFTHLLSRYLTRGLWAEALAKFGQQGAEAGESARLPSGAPEASLATGYHPHCIYEPCRDAESWTYHVPYSETERAKGTCKNVAQCSARITTQGVRGTVTTRDNVFRVRCDGGAKCTEENFVPKCSGRGLCQPDGSCDCDDGWTGPDCSTEVEPEGQQQGPGIGGAIDPDAGTTTTTTTTTASTGAQVEGDEGPAPLTGGEIAAMVVALVVVVGAGVVILGGGRGRHRDE
jgi:hypothetical protein